MANSSDTLRLGFEQHRLGNWPRAEQFYRQVIAVEPHNGDAHYLLGIAALAQGQAASAVEHLRRAVACETSSAGFQHHLGVALSMAGRSTEAVGALRAAATLEPSSAAIHNDLGNALRNVGQNSEAEACLQLAIRLDPKSVEAHTSLGNLLDSLARRQEALVEYRAAADCRPDAVHTHFNLGNCYLGLRRWSEAIAAYRQAVAIRPDLPAVHQNLATALFEMKEFKAAEASFREAIRLNPQNCGAIVGLCNVLFTTERFAEAEPFYRRALAIEPDNVASRYNLAGTLFSLNNYPEAERHFRQVVDKMPPSADTEFRLGQTLLFQGKFEEAVRWMESTIARNPTHDEAHYYRAYAWLSTGDFARGWPEYEWRLKMRYAGPPYPQPRWDGSDLKGARLLIHAEWGLGDTLHFLRYLPLVEQRGGEVVLEVQPTLLPLLKASGYEHVYPQRGGQTPKCDVQLPILSLPGIFRTTLDTIPCQIPYIAASAERVAKWRERLRGIGGLKVGIHWHGSMAWTSDPRSIPLAKFEPLARVEGVTLISLQKGDPHGQLRQFRERFPVVDFGEELDAAGGAFMDTAAIMTELDLVVTCDTGTLHVAGALGKETWAALPRASEWRWMWDRDDTPWYPSVRLFRQPTYSDWETPFRRMAEALELRVRGQR